MKCLACSVNSHHIQSFRKENLLGFFAKNRRRLLNKLMRGNGKNNENIMQYICTMESVMQILLVFLKGRMSHTLILYQPNQSMMRKLFFGESYSSHNLKVHTCQASILLLMLVVADKQWATINNYQLCFCITNALYMVEPVLGGYQTETLVCKLILVAIWNFEGKEKKGSPNTSTMLVWIFFFELQRFNTIIARMLHHLDAHPTPDFNKD
jgi:hypothetical protein